MTMSKEATYIIRVDTDAVRSLSFSEANHKVMENSLKERINDTTTIECDNNDSDSTYDDYDLSDVTAPTLDLHIAHMNRLPTLSASNGKYLFLSWVVSIKVKFFTSYPLTQKRLLYVGKEIVSSIQQPYYGQESGFEAKILAIK